MASKARTLAHILASLVLVCVISAGAQTSTNSSPIKWTATARAPSGNSKSNVVRRVDLKATIAEGWHLYALDQEPGGPRPTVVHVPAGQAFALAGDVRQPEPLMGVDPNFDIPVRYFEHEAVFRVPLKPATAPNARKGLVTVQVSFQTCNETTCLPLTTVKVEAHIQPK